MTNYIESKIIPWGLVNLLLIAGFLPPEGMWPSKKGSLAQMLENEKVLPIAVCSFCLTILLRISDPENKRLW